MDAAFAFVEASPAGGSFVFTVGGRASVADGAVAECGEGVFFGNLFKKRRNPVPLFVSCW